MNYCSHCGHSVEFTIPQGDNRQRYVCPDCGTIHYQNPRIVAGCLTTYGNKVLLCKRAIKPRYGLWTLPAGFMENGETVAQAAQRETLEEANAHVDEQHLSLYTLFNLPQINQVYMFYRAPLAKPEFLAGIESLDVDLFSEQHIPWQDIAFKVVTDTLHHFFNDRKDNHFPVHSHDIVFPTTTPTKKDW